MKIVVAPDAFKGTLTQLEAATTIKKAILSSLPNANIVMKPMADGGEGTLDVLASDSSTCEHLTLSITGPLGKQISSSIVIINGDIAMIEVAKIIGLPLINEQDRNPYQTTTYGLGEAILFALDCGLRKFVIGLGGSATNDGGFAMLQALGARFFDQDGKCVSMYGRSLLAISLVDLSLLDERLAESTFDVISDVTNPLYGEKGATEVFGPQKGATRQQVHFLDQAMKNYAHLTLDNRRINEDLAHQQGAGAAGGLGFAFLLLGGKLVSGAAYISKAMNLDQEIEQSKLVITGEGKSEAGTLTGKAPGHVAKLAKKYNVPCILISGSINDKSILKEKFTEVHTLVDENISSEKAMQNAQDVLYHKTKQILKEMI